MAPRKAQLATAWLLAAISGCALYRGGVPIPEGRELLRDQLVIHTDFDLASGHPLLAELDTLREEISSRLALEPSREPIHVYLFKAAPRYQAYVAQHYPHFPSRRAFFIETDTKLSVYAHWGEHAEVDLRHETAHGYLHSMVGNLPLWIDEGLAEYFEVPAANQGLNRPHVDLLIAEHRNGSWQPDMRRLEELTTAGELTQRDYAEAWLWAHLLIETTPERRQLLSGYLRSLRPGMAHPSLLDELHHQEPRPHAAILQHLEQLAAQP